MNLRAETHSYICDVLVSERERLGGNARVCAYEDELGMEGREVGWIGDVTLDECAERYDRGDLLCNGMLGFQKLECDGRWNERCCNEVPDVVGPCPA